MASLEPEVVGMLLCYPLGHAISASLQSFVLAVHSLIDQVTVSEGGIDGRDLNCALKAFGERHTQHISQSSPETPFS